MRNEVMGYGIFLGFIHSFTSSPLFYYLNNELGWSQHNVNLVTFFLTTLLFVSLTRPFLACLSDFIVLKQQDKVYLAYDQVIRTPAGEMLDYGGINTALLTSQPSLYSLLSTHYTLHEWNESLNGRVKVSKIVLPIAVMILGFGFSVLSFYSFEDNSISTMVKTKLKFLYKEDFQEEKMIQLLCGGLIVAMGELIISLFIDGIAVLICQIQKYEVLLIDKLKLLSESDAKMIRNIAYIDNGKISSHVSQMNADSSSMVSFQVHLRYAVNISTLLGCLLASVCICKYPASYCLELAAYSCLAPMIIAIARSIYVSCRKPTIPAASEPSRINCYISHEKPEDEASYEDVLTLVDYGNEEMMLFANNEVHYTNDNSNNNNNNIHSFNDYYSNNDDVIENSNMLNYRAKHPLRITIDHKSGYFNNNNTNNIETSYSTFFNSYFYIILFLFFLLGTPNTDTIYTSYTYQALDLPPWFMTILQLLFPCGSAFGLILYNRVAGPSHEQQPTQPTHIRKTLKLATFLSLLVTIFRFIIVKTTITSDSNSALLNGFLVSLEVIGVGVVTTISLMPILLLVTEKTVPGWAMTGMGTYTTTGDFFRLIGGFLSIGVCELCGVEGAKNGWANLDGVVLWFGLLRVFFLGLVVRFL